MLTPPGDFILFTLLHIFIFGIIRLVLSIILPLLEIFMNFEEAKALLEANDQAHVLNFWGDLDAATKLLLPEFSASQLKTLSYPEVFKKLQEIHGVGPKVAACVALFGLGYFEAFPIDVWIKRAMAELFPKGLPKNILPSA